MACVCSEGADVNVGAAEGNAVEITAEMIEGDEADVALEATVSRLLEAADAVLVAAEEMRHLHVVVVEV